MRRIDAQVHAWTLPEAAYPWVPDAAFGALYAERPFPADAVVAAMDAAGIDRALLVVPTIYGYDNRYGHDAAQAHPDRLAVVARVDPQAPGPAGRLRDLLRRPSTVAVRITGGPYADWRRGDYDALLAAAGEVGVPVCLYPAGEDRLRSVAVAAARHAATTLVVDHLGLSAPPMVPSLPPDPFQRLPELLALCDAPNIRVKLSALPLLSREPFPFRDTWPVAREVLRAFGPERVMWGSDFTRACEHHGYAEAATYLDAAPWLDDDARRWLFGGCLLDTFAWPARSEPLSPRPG